MVVRSVFGPFDGPWCDLRDLERSETHVSPELDDEIVAMSLRCPSEFFKLVVSHPHIERPLPTIALQTHCKLSRQASTPNGAKVVKNRMKRN